MRALPFEERAKEANKQREESRRLAAPFYLFERFLQDTNFAVYFDDRYQPVKIELCASNKKTRNRTDENGTKLFHEPRKTNRILIEVYPDKIKITPLKRFKHSVNRDVSWEKLDLITYNGPSIYKALEKAIDFMDLYGTQPEDIQAVDVLIEAMNFVIAENINFDQQTPKRNAQQPNPA